MEDTRSRQLGICALVLATLALVIAVTHITAGPFAPQKPVETSIAETAVAIKKAAIAAMTGGQSEPAAPARPSFDIDKKLRLGTNFLAGLALLVAIFAFARREQPEPAAAGFVLGTGVLLVSVFHWALLLICGTLLLIAIIGNLGDILGGFGG